MVTPAAALLRHQPITRAAEPSPRHLLVSVTSPCHHTRDQVSRASLGDWPGFFLLQTLAAIGVGGQCPQVFTRTPGSVQFLSFRQLVPFTNGKADL